MGRLNTIHTMQSFWWVISFKCGSESTKCEQHRGVTPEVMMIETAITIAMVWFCGCEQEISWNMASTGMNHFAQPCEQLLFLLGDAGFCCTTARKESKPETFLNVASSARGYCTEMSPCTLQGQFFHFSLSDLNKMRSCMSCTQVKFRIVVDRDITADMPVLLTFEDKA